MSEGGTSSSCQNEESSDIARFKKDALKVVSFKFVYDREDLNSENVITFKPEMAHQIFGESESIFGYSCLSITLNYLHNSCQCYLNIESSSKINKKNVKIDDILGSLNSWLPTNFTSNYDEFVKLLEKENHQQIHGEIVKTFQDKKEMDRFPEHHVKAVYKITRNNVNDEAFTDFHARFETFIVWFIDAANFIDLEDDRWTIFYVYEEFEHPTKKKIYRSPVGFCSVYNFYVFPDKVRSRISQVFVLPSHQRKGIGTALYETVVDILRATDNIVDIPVEEPTSAFQKIRDLYDCLVVHKELLKSKIDYFSTSSRVIFEIAKKNKIGRRQIQRVYDILGLYYCSEKGAPVYRKQLENIRKRIADKNERDSRIGKRFCDLERCSIKIKVDVQVLVDSEFKRHIDDIEPSVKYLQHKLKERIK